MGSREQLEIHSKDYLVRWVDVPAGYTISWSIQPHKRSLNFGLFKHPGTSYPSYPSSPAIDSSLPSKNDENSRPRKVSDVLKDTPSIVEKLRSKGLRLVVWLGKCEAEKYASGTYDVPDNEGGMFGLVFDNTFSKTVSKTVTLVLTIYPKNAPPSAAGRNPYTAQVLSSINTNLTSRGSPNLSVYDSTDSLPQESFFRPSKPGQAPEQSIANPTVYTGVMKKKRRKKAQGWAHRFFSLDFETSTISYYHHPHSAAVRGSIPLSLAAITINDKAHEISLDSGVDMWHLRVRDSGDFEGWKAAISRAAEGGNNRLHTDGQAQYNNSVPFNPAEEREWTIVEGLFARIVGSRDAIRRLAKDTDPKYLQPASPGLGLLKPSGSGGSATSSPTDGEADYFKETDKMANEKLPFWKRKSSSNGPSPSGIFRRSVSAQLAVPTPSSVPQLPTGGLNISKRDKRSYNSHVDENVHERCMEILRDLDSVVTDLSTLLSESKQRRQPPVSASRSSIDSDPDEEFFDASEGRCSRATSRPGHVIEIRDSETDDPKTDATTDDDDADDSSNDGVEAVIRKPHGSAVITAPKSLTPLPLDPVPRRNTVKPAHGPPPSILAFLRKNVGKDLSNIAMPVTSNEPTSLLQRAAEQLEYSELLDDAFQAGAKSPERLMIIAAFSITLFSNARSKERAIRKPFNPMLGETYELVREDKGFRFVSEKVSHRPVRLACQADHVNWTFLQSPMPLQKFWGKSAEINTDGRVRIIFHDNNEEFSFTLATSFLRNIVAGEKYVEPVGTMTVLNETTGDTAVATFKAGGMFAGRSEEVTVQSFDPSGSKLPLGLSGKWTTHLRLTKNGSDTGKTIWEAGALIDDASHRYGFTPFATALNEITPIEKDKIPITDSRLRPDQRALEDGDVDRAEALKAKLEERQRQRRRVMEEHSDVHRPRWFVRFGGDQDQEELWRAKTGPDGYWEERATGKWTNVLDVFEN